ncbi:MAG: SpoIIE family protein phosphatase [Epsilonproteobacteria bacterium]|nr:SpoIIE family protein phosphatase [Campylobacterota bacterium]
MSEKSYILIVDDEPINLTILELALKELNHIEIVSALDGYKALEYIEDFQIDLIILDLSMPELNGLEVLKILKGDRPLKYIPVVVVTSKSEDRYVALEMGAEDFLSKPIDAIELKLKVNNLLKLKKFNDLQRLFNEKLEEEIAKKEKRLREYALVEQELQLAREIQQRLIPKSYPENGKLEVFGSYISASQVGGDYLDVFSTDSGEYTVFIIADVSGHGFASALVSMQFRSLARIELMKGSDDFGAEVERVNRVFSNDNEDSNMFITALFLRFHHRTSTMESVNAGHYDPLGLDSLSHSEETKGIPLGILSDTTYGVVWSPFSSGDSILLYTDGILECEDSEGVMFEKRFKELYRTLQPFSPRDQVEIILEAFHEFIARQTDDVTILSIKAVE